MRHWRVNLILALFFLFSAIIAGRLVYLQVVNYQYWKALAQGQQKFFVSLRGERGEIFFRDGTPLALNRNFNLAFAVPHEIENIEETAKTLSSILNLEEISMLERLRKKSFYEVLKKRLSQEETEALKEANLQGVYVGQEAGRYYPLNQLAANVAGFLGGDGRGQYGVEGFYNDVLSGKDNILEKERGPGGYFINGLVQYSAKSSDIVLTIDHNLQFKAEKLLQSAQENLGVTKGEIIVADPNSGEILVLALLPGFDPNNYSQVSDLRIFKNSSLQELFEPGSVFKPITMAAAIDQEKITPQTTYIDTGSVKIGAYTIYNYDRRSWGEKTMTEVLEKSINTGAIFAQRALGHDLFLEYIKRFGFFEPTNIDLQGEVFSQNQEFRKGYEINFATASFGQGIEVTSLQLVRAFSAIANGGKLVNLSVVKNRSQVQNPSVISRETSSKISMMMVSTVENGFSGRAKIPGYYIAGKTGTAQIPYEDRRGYYPDRTWQSFIGFAPALEPKFLILVKLYNPQVRTAEYSAVPIFKEMAKYIIDYWQIPPDYE